MVKHAFDAGAVGWLHSAVRFHAAVSHSAIPPVVHHFSTPDGFAIAQRWASGDVLVDAFDPTVPDRDDPASPYRRFLSLPVPEIADAVRQLIHAHLPVAAAGFVAVDLYDGCVIYDFDQRRLSLIDLDMYCPGPYLLETDRQYGSRTYMAPEEWQQGSTIDERATVFTLGRFALVLLGCRPHGPADRDDFRGSDRLHEIAARACAVDRADRYDSIAELHRDWTEGILQEPGGHPTRAAVRVVILDDQDRTLLCQFGDDTTGRTWWVPPGGGKEAGETDLAAARRELDEELDRTDLQIGPSIGTRMGGTVVIDGQPFVQEERFYLCRAAHFDVASEVIERSRSEGIRDIRWWTSAQLREQRIDVGPLCLPDLIDDLHLGQIPPPDTDLGW